MHTQIEIINGEFQNGQPHGGAITKPRGYEANYY